jgi:hypothetical protein
MGLLVCALLAFVAFATAQDCTAKDPAFNTQAWCYSGHTAANGWSPYEYNGHHYLVCGILTFFLIFSFFFVCIERFLQKGHC